MQALAESLLLIVPMYTYIILYIHIICIYIYTYSWKIEFNEFIMFTFSLPFICQPMVSVCQPGAKGHLDFEDSPNWWKLLRQRFFGTVG